VLKIFTLTVHMINKIQNKSILFSLHPIVYLVSLNLQYFFRQEIYKFLFF